MTPLDIARIFFALLTVLGLIAVIAILVKRLGLTKTLMGGGSKKRLQVMETLQLDGKQKISIIRCDECEHLIVSGPQGVTTIAQSLPSLPQALKIEDNNPTLTNANIENEYENQTQSSRHNPFQALLNKALAHKTIAHAPSCSQDTLNGGKAA